MKRSFFAMLLLSLSMAVYAQEPAKEAGKVYMFGVSQQLTDSVIYITAINEVEGIELDKKTSFLPYRSAFSYQLKDFLEERLQLSQQTSCVFFSKSRKKLSKKFYKVKKLYLDNPETKIFMLDETSFKFKHPAELLQDDTDE